MVFCNKISSFTFSLKKLFSMVCWSALSVMTLMPISDTYADDHFNNGALNDATLNEIIVNADFRNLSAQLSPQSLTVVSSAKLRNRAAQHLEDVLHLAPNLNFSAGASRGRFFQVRGIGERSQFKEPLDSSVGLVVDGIDFSNLGLAGSLYDIDQVEILRGPQGTAFGSSALAGLINIQSAMPTEEFEGQMNLGAGDYGSTNLGLIVSGGLSDNLLGRFSFNRNYTDGYITNRSLNRDNTNNLDELGSRLKLRWLATRDLTIDITGFYLDADNGYDAFSLDHNRQTSSDQPGHDRQRSSALSVKAELDQFDAFQMEFQLSGEKTDLEYGFDWDWSDMDTVGVRGVENNSRKRKANSVDLRVLSRAGNDVLGGASWVAGAMAYSREVNLFYTEDADYSSVDWGAWTGELQSHYETSRYALYGQLDWILNERFLLSIGARLERFDNDYSDSYGVLGDVADDLMGGRLSLRYHLHSSTMVYGSISLGYKTAGLNTDAYGKALVDGDKLTIELLNQKLFYDDEALLNYELGLKGSYFDERLQLGVTGFYLDRQNMQAKVALEISTGNWTSYRDNVQGSHNYGFEFEGAWQALPELQISASFGVLQTELGELVVLDNDNNPQNQKGRDQAHAPRYQFNLGLDYQFHDYYTLNLQVDGKDSFYFSNSHNQQSSTYQLVHGKLSYQRGPWNLSLWGRNLTDKEYQVRGFFFANNPNNNWTPESYTQLGEPRVFGIAGQYDF